MSAHTRSILTRVQLEQGQDSVLSAGSCWIIDEFGRPRFQALSNDGIRVRVIGRLLIENWTWHGPAVSPATVEAACNQTIAGRVEIDVEHFEADEYSVLRLAIEPANHR